jgi:glycosyltransferase involved in cell wall biosynthesis
MTIPPHTVLDVSRTVSRIGAGGDSGVDRVERAYIRELLRRGGSVHFLTRVLGGLALLDAPGMEHLLTLAADPAAAPAPDLLGNLARRQSPARRRAETAVRGAALAWARHARAPQMLRERLPGGFSYLNVGHSNLDTARLARLRDGGAARMGIMIHDVIPLDYPEFSRPEAPARFEALLRAAAGAADLLIFNSTDTRRRTLRWLDRWQIHADHVTALLGVDPLPDPPARRISDPPAFVVLGTIEPRKNHLLLLNIWRQFAEELPEADIPQLHIVGRRGWENENIVDVLDRAPFMGQHVFERGFLPDDRLASLLAGARALLFPSFAEGFGYPLAEACRMGVPTISADLPVYREFIDSGPLYLDPLDGPGWKNAILSLSKGSEGKVPGEWPLPQWCDHFKAVFTKFPLEAV